MTLIQIKNIYTDTSYSLKKNFYYVLILIIYFIFISASLNLMLYIFIKKSILGISHTMENTLNSLDLSTKFEYYKRDELGKVYESFALLIQKVSEVLHEAKNSSENNAKIP